jgi:putative colanic acid biosysnthesis UDP-glucose lipid carrier transferase
MQSHRCPLHHIGCSHDHHFLPHSILSTPSLLASHDLQPRLSPGQLTPVELVRISLDPLVAIGALVASLYAFSEPFAGHYLILMVLIFSLTFPGSSPRRANFSTLAGDILANWAVVVVLLLLLGWATQTAALFDAHAMLAWACATPAALLLTHRVAPAVLPRLLAAEGMERVAVIVGANEVGTRLAARIKAAPELGLRFAGFFDDRGPGRTSDGAGDVLGVITHLAEYAKTHRVDSIYIALPMASQPRILKLLDELRDTTASIYFAPDIFLSDLIQARMDTVAGMPVLAVCETPFYGVNGLIKRTSDLILASVILILIAPLMLVIAIGVKYSSPGPVLFKQRRYGLDGREIVVYKFRTMTVAEDGEVIRQATRGDSRVTPFGAFLRRHSLDELPQFVNVLQGRMSVVGPRPHAVAHNELYRKQIKGYMIRHKVKPGITGWAQVNGLRGETDTLEKMSERIAYDLAYLRNWSLRLDLQIVARTVFVVLRTEKNAY